MKDFIHVDHLTFSYENSIEPLFEDVSFQIDRGWTAIVGANGSGKTTLLKLMCGLLPPGAGAFKLPGNSYYLAQRTDFKPNGLDEFFNAVDKRAFKIKNSLQMEGHWQNNWNNLSHGERKRCQIAAALYREPLILAIDEPSNHLDYGSRQVLLKALKSFKGIGLLVSHDRELMDNLCQLTLFIEPPRIHIRKCGYSMAIQEMEKENRAKMDKLLLANREVKKLKKRVHRQKEKISRSVKRGSKKNISSKDHDAKSRIDLARLTGKDGVESRLLTRFKTRLENAQVHQSAIEIKKEKRLGISFNAAQASRVFPIFINASVLPMGEKKSLHIPALSLEYGDKIGITGDNGSGKSSFLEHFIKTVNIPPERLLYIPQEIPAEQSAQIIRRIQNYRDDKKGALMTLVSRLGSDPIHLLETTIPSPGEVRKLMLAEGILHHPGLIIMDEPTNHMDLPSIECVQQALTECDCAQLLVSHDRVFLQETTSYFWSFTRINDREYTIRRQF